VTEAQTHGYRMPNGRHKGELITRVPVHYLKWMVCSRHSCAPHAEAELARRGTVTPELDISGHAIDRASLRCRKTWHETRGPEEGLHAWLVRVSGEALAGKQVDEQGRHYHLGMRFVFEMEGAWPVLKSIMPARHPEKGGE
jgi:hypothetical protein